MEKSEISPIHVTYMLSESEGDKTEEAGRMRGILPAEYEKVTKKVFAFYTY
jgi:hypothetical protein